MPRAQCRGLSPHPAAPWADPSFWLYTITVDERVAGYDSRALLLRLAEAGVQARPLWHPIADLPPFRGCQASGGDVAERLYRQALSLPSSTALTSEQLERVIALLRGVGTVSRT